ncbi:MAG: hypothetical protein KDF65_04100 [Anaerolineae bacterium]|nr:hypothetical protein [Anaerolineae bacterium]
MKSSKQSQNKELCRLLSAAVVNKDFCHLLLTDAELALNTGYRGETFNLSPAEKNIVLSIHAASLQDFAHQLTSQQSFAVNTHFNGNSHSHQTHAKNSYL